MNTKKEVLNILKRAGGKAVSGESIAEKLGISRTAVWKAIRSIKDDGYSVGAKTNSGYVLDVFSDVLDKDDIARRLDDRSLKDKIYVYKTLESTNLTAKKMAVDGAEKNTVVIANEQTNGRGRLGRKFYSPSDTGLYISIILRPGVKGDLAVLYTTAASVEVCRAIEKVCGVYPQIKWVNDIYLNGKKICGILTEAVMDFESAMVESLIVGIGVNVGAGAFPEDVAEIAGAISNGGEKKFSRNTLAAEIINGVAGIESKLSSGGYIDEYKRRSMVIGKRIRIVGTGETVTAKDIDDMGGLVVENDGGEIKTLSTGEISIRPVD